MIGAFMRRTIFAGCVFLLPIATGQAATASLDCARAHSATNRLICGTPELAALDRRLGDVYLSLKGQGGTDIKALAADENDWLKDVRDRCADAACLGAVYRKRIDELLDRSRRQASPASYDETRPFPADAALWNEVVSVVGTSCAGDYDRQLTGFGPQKGFLPVNIRNGTVIVRVKNGTRFAFLLRTEHDDQATCRFADVVTLPPPAQANAFLFCAIADQQSYGFGMRLAGRKKVVGYWQVDAENGKMIRTPLGVLGAEDSIRCSEPETGE
jgi:uncharacterized protein